MVGSNLLSALKKKARRYSFGERSPHRLYKGKLDATPSPGASPSKSQTPLTNSSVLSTPRQIAIQPHVDATSIDKPVPQLHRRQTEPTDSLDLAKEEVLTHTPEDSLIPTYLADEREDRTAGTLTHESTPGAGVLSTATSNFSDTTDDSSTMTRERERSHQESEAVSSTAAATVSSTAAAAAHEAASFNKNKKVVGFVCEPDVIGWSESTTKMAGDAEALLEMELQALTNRYEVLKQKAEEREQMFDTTLRSSGDTKGRGKSSAGGSGRHRVVSKREKERMKEYQLKSIEHGKKVLSVKRQTQPHLFASDEKKKDAEKNRQRWERAKLAAISMTPLQDQRGTKTTQMLRRLSMILRSNAKKGIYFNSPLDEKKGGTFSPTVSNVSGVSEVSLSLDDLLGGGSSVSKPYSPGSTQRHGGGIVMEVGSVARTAAVEVSLASMMAEAEALAKEVKLVAQGEQWTPNVESLAAPPNGFNSSNNNNNGKPVGRNLMNEFGNKRKQNGKRTPPVRRAAEAPTSYSTSKAGSSGPQHSIVIPTRHQRNLSAPMIFTELDASKEGLSPYPEENSDNNRGHRSTASDTTPVQLSSSSILEEDNTTATATTTATTTPSSYNTGAGEMPASPVLARNKNSNPSATTTPVSSVKQTEEESPVTGLVAREPSEAEFPSPAVSSKSTPLVHSSKGAAEGGAGKDLVSTEMSPKSSAVKGESAPDSPTAADGKSPRAKGLRACLPCLFPKAK